LSLRRRILWSAALQGWFLPEDESAIECMVHMPEYEPIDWVQPCPGQYFLDVGAYIGWYSIQAARAIGSSGRVLALEPDPSNLRQLKQNVALNGVENFEAFPLAAWSCSGQVGWMPGQQPVWHQVSDAGEQLMPSVSIDELITREQIPRLDWIKLDIEGAEIDALKGATATLRRFSPRLFVEIHKTRQEIAELLREAGYQIDQELYDLPPDLHGWLLATKR